MDYFIYVRKFYQYVVMALQFDGPLGLIAVCWWYCPRNAPVNGNLNCSKLSDEAPSEVKYWSQDASSDRCNTF